MAATQDGDGGTPSVRSPRTKRFVRSYGDGRTCVEPDCDTTLSRYNADPLCWRHDVERRAEAGRPRHGLRDRLRA